MIRIGLVLICLAFPAAVFAIEDQSLTPSAVESLVMPKLARELEPLGFTDIRIRFTQFPEPTKFSYSGASELVIDEMAGHRRLGIRRYKITAMGERGVRKTAFCAAAVSAEGPDIRARYHIPAGKRIALTDLAIRRVRQDDVPMDAATDVAQILDQEANRNISQGERVALDFVRQPFAVLRGEVIEVGMVIGTIEAKVFGEAQSSGFVGDQIPFKNTLSLKRFFARITGPRRAQIIWNQGGDHEG